MGVGTDEFQQRFSGRYFGKYRAVVHDNRDPSTFGRLMLIVPVVLGKEKIGWCLASEGGGVNSGKVDIPAIGAFVWCEFEEGDPNRGIWSHGPNGRQDGVDMLNQHARGQFDDEDVLVRDIGIMPPTSFEGTYPNVRGWRSQSGHLLEFDDTPGAERVQLAHRSGSRIEMLPDGGTQQVSVGGFRRRIAGNIIEEITGNYETTIAGNRVVRITGSDEVIYGSKDITHAYQNLTVTGKDHIQEWAGNFSQTVLGNFNLAVAAQGSMQFGGQLAFMIGQNLQATVLETMELVASNATGLPTSNAVLVQGYNGLVDLLATDVTGLVPTQRAEIILDPTLGQISIGMGSSVGGGLLQFTNTPLANIHLTGLGATEPFVLGIQLTNLLTTILSDLATHFHPTGVGPTGVPVTAAIYAQALAQLPTLLSLKILGS